MFSNKKNENLLYVKCGEALGCAYQVEEQKECGETSKCCDCELRIAALNSYTNNEFIYNNYITKPFLNFNNEKIDKYLRFSTRLFIFKKEKYIIMMVEDFTNFNKHEKNVS